MWFGLANRLDLVSLLKVVILKHAALNFAHISHAPVSSAGLTSEWCEKAPILSSQLWMLKASKMSWEGFVILWHPELWWKMGENMQVYVGIQATPFFLPQKLVQPRPYQPYHCRQPGVNSRWVVHHIHFCSPLTRQTLTEKPRALRVLNCLCLSVLDWWSLQITVRHTPELHESCSRDRYTQFQRVYQQLYHIQ